jgi:hypothetical protein
VKGPAEQETEEEPGGERVSRKESLQRTCDAGEEVAAGLRARHEIGQRHERPDDEHAAGGRGASRWPV